MDDLLKAMRELPILIDMAADHADDDLENRASRHQLGELSARLIWMRDHGVPVLMKRLTNG
jgi:hypothetical protein